jgi:hypothetical protein
MMIAMKSRPPPIAITIIAHKGKIDEFETVYKE